MNVLTRPVQATDETIEQAAAILCAGGLVAIPTETVYGLACDASNPDAVARLYAAKGRPAFNPLIAHGADVPTLKQEGVFNDDALELSEAFWPGPLTLVVPFNPNGRVCDLARAGLSTVALRVPAHPVANKLLRTFGGPLVAPSANPSGRLSPTEAQHVADDMGDRVDLILDGGLCALGLESTIIDCTDGSPALLRVGAIAAETIERVLDTPLRRPEFDPDAPTAPGQLLRHYAPRARLRLNATAPLPGEGFLGFGSLEGDLNLSPGGDVIEAAANLFRHLRALDARFDLIAVAPIPQAGLGAAINDRLARAAAR